MRLDHATWEEVEDHVSRVPGIILPAGSTEQHGPMGLIGTDALCAEAIAERAASTAGCLVAPVLAYTPASFNMAFAGTVSVSEALFRAMVAEIVAGWPTRFDARRAAGLGFVADPDYDAIVRVYIEDELTP